MTLKPWFLTIAAISLGALPGAGLAQSTTFFVTPATTALPEPVPAAVIELKIRLPLGRGLARELIDIGIAQSEAAEVARAAAGHLGDGIGGCLAEVAIRANSGGGEGKVERVTLHTSAKRTIIARRGEEIRIIDQSRAVAKLRLIA